MTEVTSDIHLPPTALLRLLADGQLHSGQELAAAMGVSRTAIWKQLAKLESLGLKLESKPGKGYSLSGGLDLLEEAPIRSGLRAPVNEQISRFNLFEILDSTNAWLLSQESTPAISICISECQTAGRGRRGRSWVSPFARNIYMSLRMTVETGFGSLEGLSLAVGVVVADALSDLGVRDAKLKWPNDILCKGRKLGGVLIEAAGDPAGRCHAVIGLGLNVDLEGSMAEQIDQPWVTLNDILSTSPKRNDVVITLLNHIIPMLATYESIGFKHYKSKWEALNTHLNQRVSLQMGAQKTKGIMRGVSDSGGLILSTEHGVETFHSGEISLRAEP
ncbi:MAG: bifunctional biotin--[acetyl-CoA-carboxylase] ligase/biotin operon repressor BirA [Gammaproteobacteria bacterium]|nr:MAG: bifunctional biotin--[acetyl-CoA-carboxylase] ligase/biotin operon repressor BirA [Gammaproteobacteria bacterium]